MPNQTSNQTALRGRHRVGVYVSVMIGSVVLTGTVSATPASANALNVAYTLVSGSEADVRPGMRVVVSNGGLFKGFMSIRFAGTISSTNLPVREFSLGEVQVESGDTITVYDDLVLTDKLVAGDDSFAPDNTAYTDQNSNPAPVAVSGGWWAGWLGDDGTVDVPFAGSGSYTIDPDSVGTVTHAWACASGTWDDDTAANPTLTLTAAGKYLVFHEATDVSNGKTETQLIRVRVHDDADPPYDCELSGVEGDPQSGFRTSFKLYENASLLSIPDGAPVVVWSQEWMDGDEQSYGAAVASRSHIICTGFFRRDRSSGDASGDNLEFEIISPLARLAELPGFSKALERNQSPDTWQEVKTLTVKRGLIKLLRDYTNALEMFDLIFDGFDDADYVAFYLQKNNPYEQVRELADARDGRIICDRTGRFEVQGRLELSTLADRAAITITLTLTDDDIIDYEISREHNRVLETYRARGFTAGTDANAVQPAFARAPASPARGNLSSTIEKLIVDNVSDLYARCALRMAWEDSVYFDADGVQQHAPSVRLTLFGNYAQVFQFYREWVQLDGMVNLRGVDLSDFRFIVQRVAVDYAGGTATTTLELRAETHAPPEASVDDTPEAETYVPPDLPISFPPIVSTTPPLYGSGLGVNTGTIAVFDSTNGKVHITTEFEVILASLNPAFTGYALGLTGTLSGFVVRADSPKYLNGSGAVNGYIATISQVRPISDIFGARTLSTAYSYAAGAAVGYSQVHMQAERGNAAWALVSVYNDTGGVNAYRTTNGGASWSPESSLPAFYDTNLPNNAATWKPGLWLHASGDGRALTSAAAATANPPGADFWQTTDYGATWSKVVTAGWAAGDWPCACIVKPLSRNDVVFHGFIDYVAPNILTKLYRIIGTTQTDISPVYDGAAYGVGGYSTGEGQRGLSVADDDPNAVVLVGYNAQNSKHGVFQTFTGLAASPVWNVLVLPATAVRYRGAYYVNKHTIYLFGTNGALALCKYTGGTWSVFETVISGCGTIVALCGG